MDAKALVPRDAGQLHVLGVELLLHDLLQRLQHQRLRLRQRQRLVELVLQLRLRPLGPGSDRFGVVAVEGPGRLGVESVNPRGRDCQFDGLIDWG